MFWDVCAVVEEIRPGVFECDLSTSGRIIPERLDFSRTAWISDAAHVRIAILSYVVELEAID